VGDPVSAERIEEREQVEDSRQPTAEESRQEIADNRILSKSTDFELACRGRIFQSEKEIPQYAASWFQRTHKDQI
jgi:hypothetical protein